MRAACAISVLLAFGAAARVPQHELALVQTSEQTGTGMTTEARASAWMWIRLHAWDRQPEQDELAELKGADPNAYAVVSALLAKKQLGVLNPRHPSEGFASTGTHLSAQDAASLAAMEASVVHKKPAPEEAPEAHAAPQAVYAEAGSAQHNWAHFKAEDADDEIVASLGGDSGSLLSESQEVVPDDPSPLVPSNNVAGMQIPIINWGVSKKPAAPKVALARVVPKPSPIGQSQANTYLAPGGIDFSEFIPAAEKAAPKPKPAMNQADSYLSSLGFDLKSDLVARKPKPVQKAVKQEAPVMNALTAFDWNSASSDDSKVASAAQTNVYTSKVNLDVVPEKHEESHVNPYLQMMGEDDSVSRPDASLLSRRPTLLSRQQPSNGYLQAINFNGARETKSLYGTFENDLDR